MSEMVKIYKKYDKLEKPIVKLVEAIHALNGLNSADQKNILKGVSYVLGEEINTIEAFIAAIRIIPEEEKIAEAKEKCFAAVPIKFGEYDPPEPEEISENNNTDEEETTDDDDDDVEKVPEEYIYDTATGLFKHMLDDDNNDTESDNSTNQVDDPTTENAKQTIIKMDEHFANMRLLGGAKDGRIYLCKNSDSLQEQMSTCHQVYPPDYKLMKELSGHYRGTSKGPTKTLLSFEQVLACCIFIKDVLVNTEGQKMSSVEMCNNLRKFMDTFFPDTRIRGENVRDIITGHSHAKISAPFFHYNTLTRMVYIN